MTHVSTNQTRVLQLAQEAASLGHVLGSVKPHTTPNTGPLFDEPMDQRMFTHANHDLDARSTSSWPLAPRIVSRDDVEPGTKRLDGGKAYANGGA
ncbi:hypothetical protein NMY22_g18788 [Coprinellus aureogranulatus]|nr:hypothetical protein NMY22_g18788 [Coprinellus aureogranulatus]